MAPDAQGNEQAPEVNTTDTGATSSGEAPAAAETEFDRSQVRDPVLQSLFKQLDRIEELQSRLAQRFL